MVKLSVGMDVEELVVAIEEVMTEMSGKYMKYMWVGVVSFTVMIFLVSCIGSICGQCIYHFYRRKRQSMKEKKKRKKNSYILAKTDIKPDRDFAKSNVTSEKHV